MTTRPILEVDGPPIAFFTDALGRQYTYECFGLAGPNERAGELALALAAHMAAMAERGVIVWRRRPAWGFENGAWRLTYRCVVVPWDAIPVPSAPPVRADGEPL